MICASAAAPHGVAVAPQFRPVAELTSATFPPVALMLIGVGSVMSGLSGVVPPPPAASWTSRYWPGETNPERGVIWAVFAPRFPAVAPYWTDMPVVLISERPRLKTSMKSFV